MLRVAGQGKPLRVVADQHCTPSFTADIAAATWPLLDTPANGLFHLTNAGATTWFELAHAIFEKCDMPATLTPITTTEFGAAAARPPYSVLDCTKAAAFGVSLRPWPQALAAYLAVRASRGQDSR